jgi:drug/metabolite transporter (DMT)-like permease
MFWRYLFLLIGVFAGSTAAILIKASQMPAPVLAATRLALAALFLSPLFFFDLQRQPGAFTRLHLQRTLLPSVVLAAHFISWAYGARLTLSAQASLIVNLAPIAIPFFLHALTKEAINRREIIGTLLALAGLMVLNIRDARSGGGDLLGNCICFGSMLLFAWYLALGRRNRDFPSLWLYVVPIYFQAALLCLVVSIPWRSAYVRGSAHDWLLLTSLALFPTIIGHSLLNYSMRHFRGQVVSLCNVGQFVFAAMMAFFLFHESPSATFYAASLLVVAGIALAVFSAPSAPPRMR